MTETKTDLDQVRIRPYASGDTSELLQLWALSMPQDAVNEAGFLQKVAHAAPTLDRPQFQLSMERRVDLCVEVFSSGTL